MRGLCGDVDDLAPSNRRSQRPRVAVLQLVQTRWHSTWSRTKVWSYVPSSRGGARRRDARPPRERVANLGPVRPRRTPMKVVSERSRRNSLPGRTGRRCATVVTPPSPISKTRLLEDLEDGTGVWEGDAGRSNALARPRRRSGARGRRARCRRRPTRRGTSRPVSGPRQIASITARYSFSGIQWNIAATHNEIGRRDLAHLIELLGAPKPEFEVGPAFVCACSSIDGSGSTPITRPAGTSSCEPHCELTRPAPDIHDDRVRGRRMTRR